jgi:hypothetical protein
MIDWADSFTLRGVRRPRNRLEADATMSLGLSRRWRKILGAASRHATSNRDGTRKPMLLCRLASDVSGEKFCALPS